LVGRGRDGAEAVDIVASLAPDVLLMDINMPHLDGIFSAMIVSERHSGTQVILMSAEDSPELRYRCRFCGAISFVHKSNLLQSLPGAYRPPLTPRAYERLDANEID
jgi:DNA-binding NarL/FixJ family response regulator